VNKLKETSIPLAILLICLVVVGIGITTSCREKNTQEAEIIIPRLIFQSQDQDEAYTFAAARDITVDQNSALYIFDYSDYTIKKYDQTGEHICTFGGQGDGIGKFVHLCGIKATTDILLSVDSIGLSSYSLQGQFLNKLPFANEVLIDHPSIFENGSFFGQQIVADELKAVLTYRSPKGQEISRLAFYDLREFFPELKEGDDFFLNNTYARFYSYTNNRNGDIIWAASDRFQIYRYREGVSQPIISGDYTPIPVPEDTRKNLLARKEKISPPLFMYVPERYQLIHHLLVDSSGDIWVYLKSQEQTGFLRYSEKGKLKSQHSVDVDFDVTETIVRLFNDRVYFLVTGRKSAKVYEALLPHSR